jgi:hypothetical protein
MPNRVREEALGSETIPPRRVRITLREFYLNEADNLLTGLKKAFSSECLQRAV